VPDLCCNVTQRLVELVGFDPVVSFAMAVFEHVKDELAVIPFCSLRPCDMFASESTPPAYGGQQAWQHHPVQSSPVQSTFQCECIRLQLHAALNLLVIKLNRETVKGRIRISETPQSHRGQPVICLVYTVAVRSQSTHHICSNTMPRV